MNKFITLNHLKRVVSAITNRFKSLENAVKDIEETVEAKADISYVDNKPGAMKVTVTGDSDHGYSADKTFDEIYTHIQNGGSAYMLYGATVYKLLEHFSDEISFSSDVPYQNYDSKHTLRFPMFGINNSNIVYEIPNNIIYIEDVTLNGSTNYVPSFYAPTTAGTSGQVLTSNGSGAPTWSNLSTPTAATATPLMDGTAAVGSSSKYAKEDHVHPSDTTKVNVSDVLTKTNTTSYTPSADYHPATKKYVDDKAPLMLSAAFHETQEGRVVFTGATPKQVAEAFSQGRTVYAMLAPQSGEHILLTLTDCSIDSDTYDGYYFCFTSTAANMVFPSFCVINVNISGASSSSAWHGEDTSWLGNYRISNYIPYLEALEDVSLNNSSDGQVLVYDATNYVWKNATIPTGATYTLSMTNNVITLTGSNGSTSSVTLPVYGGEVDAVWEGGNY